MTPARDAGDFAVTRIRALRGPNYWRLAPVIACDVRLGALEGVASAELDGFAERLLGALPGLRSHPCSRGGAGAFVARLEVGTDLPHVLEHVALELQRMAGADVHFGRVVPSGEPGMSWVVVAYEEEPVGIEAMEEAARLVRACVAGAPYDAAAVTRRLQHLYEHSRLDPSTSAIVEEARRRGIPVRRLDSRSLVQLGLGRNLRRIQGTITDLTSAIGAEIARDPEATRHALEQAGLPAPQGGVADTLDDALALAARLGYPVILKPLTPTHGAGTSDRIDTPELLREAWAASSGRAAQRTASPRRIVEAFAAGREHRVLVVNGRVVACAERVPAIDRTDEMHPENVTACEMAAGVVGLDVAGVDVLTPNVSVPFRENGAVITAVHAGPELGTHARPAEGAPRDVAAAIVDMLFAPGRPASVPIIAVTGTNGKTTTTRLIAHLFRHTGVTVGFTTTDGVYLGYRLLVEGDMTGPFSANVILGNPTVDVAVLETARGGLLRGGLGFDACDVGVVINVTADHLGLRGIHTVEQLADVKGVVAAVTKREGHAVLNADDPLVVRMRERTGADVAYFSTRAPGENPEFEAHLERGGIGARVEDDTFVVHRGRLRIPIAAVRDVPLLLGGAATFQTQNVLAAILAASVLGVRDDDIRAGLLTFVPSPALTPGRLNVLRLGRRRVIVDYAHNAAAVTGLVEFAGRLEARRRLGVVTAPGDRRDEDLRTLGRIASALDYVILKEDEQGRGRPEGEIARLIREGLLEGGRAPEDVEVVLDERDAVLRALEVLEDGDLCLVLANDVRGVLALLAERGATA